MIKNKGRYIVIKDNSTKDVFIGGIYGVRDVLVILIGTGVVAGLLWLISKDPFIVFQYGLYTLVILCILRFEIPEYGLMVQTILWRTLKYRTGTRHYQFKETQKFRE